MTTATTTYSPRVTRDGDDFLAEVAVWSDSPVPEYIFVGYFERHSDAYAAACEESTDCAARAAADAAIAEQDAEIPTCCESCGLPLAIEDAFLADNLNVCGDCYGSGDDADFARRSAAIFETLWAANPDALRIEEYSARADSDARRACREALATAGALMDDAADKAQVQAA